MLTCPHGNVKIFVAGDKVLNHVRIYMIHKTDTMFVAIYLVHAEVGLRKLYAALARTVPTALNLRYSAKITGSEKIVFQCPSPHFLYFFGSNKFSLIRLLHRQ